MQNDVVIEQSVFQTLYELDVRDKLEKKKSGGNLLDYLNWAHAWAEVKLRYPDASYEIEKFGEDNLPYQLDPQTGYLVWVKTTIKNETHEMWLPVLDGANKAMKAEPYVYITKSGEKTCEAATMYDINKAIMRCLVKCLATHGVGLSLYFKETIAPEAADKIKRKKDEEKKLDAELLKAGKTEILELMGTMIKGGIDKTAIYSQIESISGKKNPNSINNIEKCGEVLEALIKMQETQEIEKTENKTPKDKKEAK